MSRLIVGCFIALIHTGFTFADKDAAIEPMLVEVGSLLASEAIDGSGDLAAPFQVGKGAWKRVDGVIVGKELAADEHAAVLSYQHPNRDSVVKFSFKVDGNTNGFHFSLNRKRGHLFRVIVTPDQMRMNLDKDKKDPKSKPIKLGEAKARFEPGKWYTMMIEMRGNKVVAQTDNGADVHACREALDVDKPNYRFVMRGDSLCIDDLQIWEAK